MQLNHEPNFAQRTQIIKKMPFSKPELDEITKIINTGLERCHFPFEVGPISTDDIDNFNLLTQKGLIPFEEQKNPITKVFNRLSKNRYCDFGQFNHFKSVGIALDIISRKEIQVSNLFSNQENDFAEYTEFYKRVGLFHQLIPKDYEKLKATNSIDPSSRTPADDERENIFVLCFTQDNHNENFWKKYAADKQGNPDHGVSIGFRFSNFKPETAHLYDFRDVFYDSGYDFDFLNHMNFYLTRKFKSIVFSAGVVKFSKFYKRGAYKWENETRLCFHYDRTPFYNIGEQLDKIFPIQEDSTTGRKYINLPLGEEPGKNPLFDLTITEVACGKNVTDENLELLTAALNARFPNAFIWRRI